MQIALNNLHVSLQGEKITIVRGWSDHEKKDWITVINLDQFSAFPE